MKKFAAISTILVLLAGLSSCTGVEWDSSETLMGLSKSWASEYVGALIPIPTTDDTRTIETLNDTLHLKYQFNGCERGDSIRITTTIRQIDDSLIVFTDGYRFSNDIKAHIFTPGTGIINYSGTLHIDFYETGQINPWAWTEITFDEYAKESGYKYNSFKNASIGWY